MVKTTFEALGGFFFPARRRRLLAALERSLPAKLNAFSAQFRAAHRAAQPFLLREEERPIWAGPSPLVAEHPRVQTPLLPPQSHS